MTQGQVVLAGTPIGASVDASERLSRVLATADIIAAEDTRVFRKLALRLGVEVSGQVIAYFEGNEAARTPELVGRAASGATVVLVSDAGMPSVSDPGYRLVSAAIAAGVRVSAVPGPSAVLTALAVSGLPTDRFCFEGFLPRKQGERRRRLVGLATEERTMVFFEAPHRLAGFLADAADALGADRPGAICRELTKPHEEVVRGGLASLASWAAGEVRGEVTVVIGGAERPQAAMPEALDLVRARIAAGEKLSAAVAEVAALTGVNRRSLYSAALAEKEDER
ncbi:MAG: 16S rRNA (cytidine(1402)-2'-O)-methyltransferase [Propionibacteriaceae bacterium]|nr:16S rRNA (cytidine(1402)-2'-O)-methyltransferase [Propionibacteriaceae bacterium]